MPCEPKNRLNLFEILTYPIILLVTIAFLVTVVFAYQTAKVIHLAPADQAEGKKLWNDLQSAQKAWAEYESRIADKYKSKDKEWENGFTISEDFSVIVPKSSFIPSLSVYPIGTLTNKACNTYPCSYSDGCNITTCTAPGLCTSTLVNCLPK